MNAPSPREIVENTLVPVASRPRIQALDVIRGLSILGIIAVNADGYAAPIGASLNPVTWIYPTTKATAVAYWITDTFFHEKFVALFSMLFGVSLFLVGGERGNRQKSRVLWRRLSALMLFALFHGFGIWWGDILSLYACAGVAMFFCRSWRPKMLMLIGVSLYGAMLIHSLPFEPKTVGNNFLRTAETAYPNSLSSDALQNRKLAIASTMQEARSSWSGAYRVNTRTYLHQLKGIPLQIPATLGLMMIGLSLFKSGFLSAQASTRTYGLLIALGSVALVLIGWVLWQKDVQMIFTPRAGAIEMLLSPLVSLFYASSLILLLRTKVQGLVSPLAAAGRVAFTNYLTQSLIMTSIFYGGRGGLMGEMNRLPLWGMVFAIWLLQLAWSPIWLSRFDMGPFEWAWRCMTYGKRVPFLKRSPA